MAHCRRIWYIADGSDSGEISELPDNVKIVRTHMALYSTAIRYKEHLKQQIEFTGSVGGAVAALKKLEIKGRDPVYYEEAKSFTRTIDDYLSSQPLSPHYEVLGESEFGEEGAFTFGPPIWLLRFRTDKGIWPHREIANQAVEDRRFFEDNKNLGFKVEHMYPPVHLEDKKRSWLYVDYVSGATLSKVYLTLGKASSEIKQRDDKSKKKQIDKIAECLAEHSVDQLALWVNNAPEGLPMSPKQVKSLYVKKLRSVPGHLSRYVDFSEPLKRLWAKSMSLIADPRFITYSNKTIKRYRDAMPTNVIIRGLPNEPSIEDILGFFTGDREEIKQNLGENYIHIDLGYRNMHALEDLMHMKFARESFVAGVTHVFDSKRDEYLRMIGVGTISTATDYVLAFKRCAWKMGLCGKYATQALAQLEQDMIKSEKEWSRRVKKFRLDFRHYNHMVKNETLKPLLVNIVNKATNKQLRRIYTIPTLRETLENDTLPETTDKDLQYFVKFLNTCRGKDNLGSAAQVYFAIIAAEEIRKNFERGNKFEERNS